MSEVASLHLREALSGLRAGIMCTLRTVRYSWSRNCCVTLSAGINISSA